MRCVLRRLGWAAVACAALAVGDRADADSTFQTFDYPGAKTTSLDGINDSGQLVGAYVGADGVLHTPDTDRRAPAGA